MQQQISLTIRNRNHAGTSLLTGQIFTDENLGKFSKERERRVCTALTKMFFFSLLILGRSGFARDDNVHGPFSPEHINSNVPSVFFTRKR